MLSKDKPIRVLLIEDDGEDAAEIRDLLGEITLARYDLDWVATFQEGIDRLRRNVHDVCLQDFFLGSADGLDVLRILGRSGCRVPIVILTGNGTPEVDLAAMQAGAMDYLEKGSLTPDGLERSLRYAIQRRRTEEALRASEERLSLATDASGIGYWDWDLRQNRFTWGEQTRELLGLPRGIEPAYPVFLKALYPEDRERTEAEMVRAVTGHQDYECEYRVVWPDGGVHWLYDRGRAIYDEAGQPLRMAGMVMEITARKVQEQLLRESEQRFRCTFENAAVGITHLDLDGHWLRVNQHFCEILGYTEDELRQKTFLNITHPEDVEEDWEQYNRLLRGEIESFEIEKRYVRKDGQPIWVSVTRSAQRDAAGRPLYSIAIIKDISARKQQELSLSESEQRFRGTFENAAVGISHMDPNGNWLRVNQKLCEILGYSREDLLKENFLFVTHPDEREAEAEQYSRLMHGEIESYSTDKRFVRRDGRAVWLHVTRALQRNESGQPVYSISVVQDISDRKQAEEALRESEAFGRSVLSSMPAHVVVLDRQGTVIQVNGEWRRFARDNGAADPERAYLGENYLEVCRRAITSGLPSAEGAAECLEQLQALLSGAIERFDLEYPCHAPWERRWFLMRAAPLSGPEGGVVISHINITERKRAEEALAESEERFRAFMDNSPALAWIKDEAGRYVYVNKTFERYFGVWFQEWRGKTDFDLWPEDAQHFRDNDLAALTSGQATEQIEETSSPSGEHDYWWNFKFPVQDAKGGKYVGGVAVNITERKRAEAMLRESEELRRLALEASAQGTWDWNLLSGEVHWDDRTREIFGVAGGAMTYEQFMASLIHPQDRHIVDTDVNRTLAPASGGIFDAEFRVVWRDGSVHWVASKGQAIFEGESAARRAVRFIGTVMDIDARKQAEEQLRQQAQMLDQAPVLVRNLDDEIVLWNQGMEKLYGWPDEEALGRVSHELLRTQFPEPLEEIRAKLHSSGHWEGELRHTCRDGALIEVASLWTLYHDAQDVPAAIIEVNHDITAIKQAEAALRERAQRIRATFDHAAVGIIEYDIEGRFLAANDRVCQILGYSREELLGMRVHDLTHPEDRANSDELNESLHEGRVDRIDYEKRYLKRDGSPLCVHVTASVIRDDAGRFQRAIGTVEDISARKRAEAEVDMLARFPAENPSPVMRMDREHRLIYCNDACRLLLEAWDCQLGQSLPEAVRTAAETAWIKNESIEMEVTTNGHTYSLILTPIADQGYINVYGRDITDRKRAEDLISADLRAMERLQQVGARSVQPNIGFEVMLEELLEAAIDITGADKGNLQLLDAPSGGLGIKAQRGFSEPFLIFFETVGNEPAPCGVAMLQGKRVVVEDVTQSPILCDTPALAAVLEAGVRAVQSTPLVSSAGHLLGMISTHFSQPHHFAERDLSLMDLLARQAADFIDRKQAEDALRQSEQRLSVALGAGQMGTFSWDPSTGEVDCDPRHCMIWGFDPSRHTVTAEEIYARIHPDDLSQVRDWEAEALRSGNQKNEFRILWSDGQVRWLATYAAVVGTEQVQHQRVIGVNYDITERKRVEAELQIANERLQEADRRKDEFLAMLGHELRNPLAPIRNSVQLLGILGPAEPRLQRQREIIERQVGHMVRLVDDLLDVSRITRGKIELKKEIVNLSEVIARAIETVHPLIESRHHRFEICLPDEPLRAEADPVRIAQVVGNLLNNAAKYTEEGGHLWLAADREDHTALIQVHDNGSGIRPEVLPRLFDLFSQAERTLDRSQGGLGIGLFLVRRLVEMHGGSVHAWSQGLGKGSLFLVRLPLLLESEPSPPAPDHLDWPRVTENPGPGPVWPAGKVLIVDDNVDQAVSLAELLEIWGQQVRVAHDGAAGLEAARQFQPDLILLDIGLPGIDGYEVARRLRQDPETREMTLVALTGYGQDEDRSQAYAVGFDQHLVKPVAPDILRELLVRKAA